MLNDRGRAYLDAVRALHKLHVALDEAAAMPPSKDDPLLKLAAAIVVLEYKSKGKRVSTDDTT